MHPQLPVLPPRPNRQAWIARYLENMAEIDRQLAELPKVIKAVQAEVKE